MKIQVKVKTNSKFEEVEKLGDNLFSVRVNSPPIDGKANQRVTELLAQYFKIPKSKVQLFRGAKSKIKFFEIYIGN